MNFYIAEFPMNLRDFYELPDNSGKNSFENACIAIKQIQNYYKSLRNNFIYDEVRSMSSLEANACYNRDRNSFYICAALLNEPFYSKSYSYEHLLASLGTVIAHEISHSFDTNFMIYSTGWGEGEFYKYQEFERSIIRLYDGVEDAYKIKNNGKRTMAEANADLFAVSCVLKILKKHVENPDYKEFFTLFAQNYRNITSKSSLEYNMLKDGHPLPRARVNCCVANFEEFYDAFDITSKDKMYVEPENRIKLW